ncbi:BON domain-containing protein [Rhodopseudomonas palustris]|uniref:BON domain-containing protein n=1 Tax=Rhodopseudomonas palustris TaxID=1076 RepID=A0AAX3E2Q5_RHOPL|nr:MULTISPECIES: BON domain-containing protein [Rhodopseudomonas]AVT75707.1 transport-associated protein [Rhodopseudomonas palustris]AVT80524.1 transport-associated protein [Rhodopseudomonas palustris]NEV78432.1 BON domain-containing protein [Rhodopseudomonas sp. BR0C11]UYO41273.1 BON domain-containing protein [Rhodopseudomonas palustris]UYO46003.1 BON domain-containing protein [Rhodopseudomonas palustris]
MSESQLRQNILDEFEFDPSFNSGHIKVAVEADRVILSGHVISYADKVAAIAATRRVKGVHAITDHLEVRSPFNRAADDQIAQRACDLLEWNVLVPSSSVDVQVENGWLTLSGTVDWHFERAAAEDDVRKLAGVMGVTNNIVINNPLADHSCIRDKIESALRRHAEIGSKTIRVTVKNGNIVILEGRVDTWDERRAAQNAAWSTPGVAAVDDRLMIN